MQAKPLTTGHLKEVLNYLPEGVVEALADHADTYGLTDAQVLELAIVNLLDMDSSRLSDLPELRTLAEMREENARLKAQLRALGQNVED